MSSVPAKGLYLAWCEYRSAQHAVMRWHYSRCMPSGKLITVGAWEHGQFIGAIIFSHGANHRLYDRFSLQSQLECCELTRVALRSHEAPVSRIVSIAARMVARYSSGLRCIISYADPQQDHHGGIYQAMGWVYVGHSRPRSEIIVEGTPMHMRSVTSRYGTASVPRLNALGVSAQRGEVRWKHTYALGLDESVRTRLKAMAKPYPKRVKQASSVPTDGGGAAPTHTLQDA